MSNVLSLDQRVRLTAALVEGNSIRSTERLCSVHRDTVMRWGLTIGEACARLHTERVTGLYTHLLQLDEIWTFVFKKQKRTTEADDAEFGDQYTFVGIDANTKLVVGYLTGKRTAENTQTFCDDLRACIVGAPQISTDGFAAYRDAIEFAFGTQVHHGVAVKLYEDEDDAGSQRRYSAGRVTGIERTRVSGSPIEESISTSYIERSNGTMRGAIRRFTRLSSGFSKRLRNLRAAVALHFAYYNFCRIHGTIRVTPAMQSGLTDHCWSIEELITMAMTAPDPSNDGAAPPRALVAGERGRPALRVIDGGRR